MAQTKGKLNPTDRERLNRLYEEVVERLQEASLIVARSLGKEPIRRGAVTVAMGLPITSPPQYIAPSDNGAASPEVWTKILCAEGFCWIDGQGGCYVQDEKAGVSRPC